MGDTLAAAHQGKPLYNISPERANRQFDINISPKSTNRDSAVSCLAAKFDSMHFQGKTLERKTNDAALKRAMLGREEAEGEMRRYREEARSLRKQVDDLGVKCVKWEERFSGVQEKYVRSKETHQHTEKLWNDQLRRARKEAFKTSSLVVKLQEELKSSRAAHKMAQAEYDTERERSSKREQEAFAARYQLVEVQQEVDALQQAIKLVEQERDALRTVAKNEEVARIAAEGRIPLPVSNDEEFGSPRRASRELPPVTVLSSAASEEEITTLREQIKLERYRCDKAFQIVDFLQVECQLSCCACRRTEKIGSSFVHTTASVPQACKDEIMEDDFDIFKSVPPASFSTNDAEAASRTLQQAVFLPEEGIFRVEVAPGSQLTRELVHTDSNAAPTTTLSTAQSTMLEPASRLQNTRTPSCEPPSFAQNSILSRTSLLSLLDTPSQGSFADDSEETTIVNPANNKALPEAETYTQLEECAPSVPTHTIHTLQALIHSPPNIIEDEDDEEEEEVAECDQSEPSPSPKKTFHTISTTTTIPLSDPDSEVTPPHLLNPPMLPSFDRTNNALSPTMTREEALAMIRERRGRAQSMAAGTATPRRPGGTASNPSTAGANNDAILDGAKTPRRDISAPAAAGSRSVGRTMSRGRPMGRA